MKTNPPLLEVCVLSADEAEAAVRAGAGRVELCADLARDGLTPPVGMVCETVRRLRPLGAAVAVMLRPVPPPGRHAFGVSEEDARELEGQAQALLAAGADALVFGFLTLAGEVDWPLAGRLLAIAQSAGRESVFHRAVDAASRPDEAVAALLSAGFTRILTSGGAPTAQQGAATLTRWHQRACQAGRPGFVLPGGGIRAHNVGALRAATGIRQAHGAFRSRVNGQPEPLDVAGVKVAVETGRNAAAPPRAAAKQQDVVLRVE